MARSFALVDYKLAEADFFLKKIPETLSPVEVQFYFSAFVTAARSVTFSLQFVMADQPRFHEWYRGWQETLANDELARFFKDTRNDVQKTGENPVRGGSMKRRLDGTVEFIHYFSHPIPLDLMPAGTQVPDYPHLDVVSACHQFLSLLTELVFDCYLNFSETIDAHAYYTAQNFEALGLSIEDAEDEIIGRRGWTSPVPLAARWELLRSQVTGCEIDHLFQAYLGKSLPWWK